tara:strand:- start:870 stop:1310 length:441 start_codon:yes stop_codon:yes gene_type:complete
MEVREVSFDELGGVLDLIDQFDRVISPRPSSDSLQSIFKQIKASGGAIIGVFAAGKILGTCTVNLCANLSWSGRPYAIIENVVVDSSHRGKGIGTAILHFAKKFAEESGCYKVALMTGSKRPETLRFYENAGFSGTKIGFQKRFSA